MLVYAGLCITTYLLANCTNKSYNSGYFKLFLESISCTCRRFLYFPNVKTVEDLFSIQTTDSFISWVPPVESIKHVTLETGTITSKFATRTLTGTGTNFTTLTVGDSIFTSITEVINVVTGEELTTDVFVGVIESIASDTELVLKTFPPTFTEKTFKAVAPTLFYIPTSWTKERKVVNIGGAKLFHTSLSFTLKTVY